MRRIAQAVPVLLLCGCVEEAAAPQATTHDVQAGAPEEPEFELPEPGTGWAAAPTLPAWLMTVPPQAFDSVDPARPEALVGAAPPRWTSGRAMAVHGSEIVIADTEHDRVVWMDRTAGTIERGVAVGSRPEQVVVGPDGTTWVTVRYAGWVARIAPGAAEVDMVAQVGVEPFGLGLSPDGTSLVVSVSGEDRLVLLDPTTLTLKGGKSTSLRPRGLVMTDDEVWVATQFGPVDQINLAGQSLGGSLTRALRTANPADEHFNPGIIQGTVAGRALAVTAGLGVPEGTTAIYVAHILARPGSAEATEAAAEGTATTVISASETHCVAAGYGGQSCTTTSSSVETVKKPALVRPIEPTVSVFAGGAKLAGEAAPPVRSRRTGHAMTTLLDQPIDVAHHPTHHLLFVVGQGTDNVLALATNVADPMTSPVAELRVGRAPKAIAFSDDGVTAYVLNAQDFTVSEVDIRPLLAMPVVFSKSSWFNQAQTVPVTLVHARVAAFASDLLPEALRLGRRAFTFARTPGVSGDGRFACATCHYEGTEDKLVWFISDGPRQTPMLAGRIAGTEPFNWKGSHLRLVDNIANTVNRLGGDGLTAKTLESLAAFISGGLVPPPNRWAGREDLEPQRIAGQAVFEDPAVGCAVCHRAPTYSDPGNHDVGTATDLEAHLLELTGLGGASLDTSLKMNTPSLIGLHYTAPYLHDGSAATLDEVLEITSGHMGHAELLSAQERSDLIVFLQSL